MHPCMATLNSFSDTSQKNVPTAREILVISSTVLNWKCLNILSLYRPQIKSSLARQWGQRWDRRLIIPQDASAVGSFIQSCLHLTRGSFVLNVAFIGAFYFMLDGDRELVLYWAVVWSQLASRVISSRNNLNDANSTLATCCQADTFLVRFIPLHLQRTRQVWLSSSLQMR